MRPLTSLVCFLPSTSRRLGVLVACGLAVACANANVTGNRPTGEDDPSTIEGPGGDPDVTDPNAFTGGDEPVTLPVDGNGTPQVGKVGLRYIGRANSGNVLSWSGSALELHFSGTDATFAFQAPAGTSYVGITTDGASQGNVALSGNQPLTIGPLSDSDHIVRLTKLNEAKLGEFRMTSMSVTGQLQTPHFASRRIEVIGDSIASGYGIDGNGPNCTNTSATENALAAFPALLGNTFGADVSVISYSGRGVFRNDISDLNNTLPVIPAYWTRTIASGANNTFNYPSSQTPDAVVIMLGTNDYEYTQNSNGVDSNARLPLDHNSFVTSYTQFVQSILTQYPGAKILLCGSPLLNDSYPTAGDAQHTSLTTDLNSVVAAVNMSQQVQVLPLSSLSAGATTGCGSHPNRSGHQQLASSIASALSNLLGW